MLQPHTAFPPSFALPCNGAKWRCCQGYYGMEGGEGGKVQTRWFVICLHGPTWRELWSSPGREGVDGLTAVQAIFYWWWGNNGKNDMYFLDKLQIYHHIYVYAVSPACPTHKRTLTGSRTSRPSLGPGNHLVSQVATAICSPCLQFQARADRRSFDTSESFTVRYHFTAILYLPRMAAAISPDDCRGRVQRFNLIWWQMVRLARPLINLFLRVWCTYR